MGGEPPSPGVLEHIQVGGPACIFTDFCWVLVKEGIPFAGKPKDTASATPNLVQHLVPITNPPAQTHAMAALTWHWRDNARVRHVYLGHALREEQGYGRVLRCGRTPHPLPKGEERGQQRTKKCDSPQKDVHFTRQDGRVFSPLDMHCNLVCEVDELASCEPRATYTLPVVNSSFRTSSAAAAAAPPPPAALTAPSSASNNHGWTGRWFQWRVHTGW